MADHASLPMVETTRLLAEKGECSTPAKPVKPLRFPLGLVPEPVRPYLELMRVDKPTGAMLVIWPYMWGLTLAAYTTELPLSAYLASLAKCIFGGFIVRASACTINDICDRDMDIGVERTKNRPLASGRVSVFAASAWLVAQWLLALVFFFLTWSKLAFCIAMFQMVPASTIYPLLKQVTYWPQAWLGIAINLGVCVAWADIAPAFDLRLNALMMASCWCWTMLYDTIYACQDKKDDVNMGVHSTALLFGRRVRVILSICAATFVALLAVAGIMNGQTMPYFLLSVGGAALHLVWQFSEVDFDDAKSCGITFMRNGQLGLVVWTGLLLDYAVRISPLSSYLDDIINTVF